MKNLGRLMLMPIALAALCIPAHAQMSDTNIVTVQGGRNYACETTDLPVNVWSLVAYDNAGQPCVTKASQVGDPGETCDPDSVWDWQVQGHMVFAPVAGKNIVKVEIQLWAGNGGGSCHGGTTDPIFCDNPAYHYLQESAIYESTNPNVDLAAPFEFLFYLMPPYFSEPGDANYAGFWVYAKPIGNPAVCVSQNYWDLAHN
jgi:hypothetical protein